MPAHLSQLGFVLHDGQICPGCYRAGILLSSENQYHDSSAIQYWKCGACKSTWLAVYHLCPRYDFNAIKGWNTVEDYQLIGYAGFLEGP